MWPTLKRVCCRVKNVNAADVKVVVQDPRIHTGTMSGDKGNKTCASPPTTHIKARSKTYCSNPKILRFEVPDDKVSWSKEFNEYKPEDYTAASVKAKPVWADVDIRYDKSAGTPAFNKLDGEVDRTSLNGEYVVFEGLPRNPVGRTGVTGRGKLGRWGPNHAADPIATRWKIEKGNVVKHAVSKNPVLQFVAIQRSDTGEWALPGGMVDPGENTSATLSREFGEEAMNSLMADDKARETIQTNIRNLFDYNGKQGMKSPGEDISFTLKREFGEETMNSLEASESEKEKIAAKIAHLFKHGTEVYCGYVDDPRNTDNSWMETVVFNFHDETGLSVGKFNLTAGDDAKGVKWMDIDKSLNLYASHNEFLHETAKLHKAHW